MCLDRIGPQRTLGIQVSVIIPAYNTAQYIRETLESVFIQTFRSREVIVINDGSPDSEHLEQVLAPFRDRILYLKQESRGPGGARNTGIRHAQGEYLAFLDSDDCWPPDYLAAQMKLFELEPDLDLVYSDAEHFGESPLSRPTFMQVSNPPVTIEDLLIEGCQILPSATVVRRQVTIDAGLFDESAGQCEDYDMWLRIAYKGAKLGHQSTIRIFRRIHANALTAESTKAAAGLALVLSRWSDRLQHLPRAQVVVQARLTKAQAEVDLMQGKSCLARCDFKSATELLGKANTFFRRPKLKLTILGLRTVPRLTRKAALMWQEFIG